MKTMIETPDKFCLCGLEHFERAFRTGEGEEIPILTVPTSAFFEYLQRRFPADKKITRWPP